MFSLAAARLIEDDDGAEGRREKPAPWSGAYQPTAWPTSVATKAPAMPSAVVRMKPVGLLGAETTARGR